ncbi:methylated-DNA--[protein]-cysteine S-methyltransferase [Georgenia sp. Z1491]|uniref:methylated-DNA--[protein]-cysteine S-methyltransferase n=1 Tax=Georgenia sp. Z1491 TaxID=3416707 RepID=UPI003CF9D487
MSEQLHVLTVPSPAGDLTVVVEPGTGVLRGTSFWGADDILGRLGLGPDEVVGGTGEPAPRTPATDRVVETFARYASGEIDALDALEVSQPGGPFTQRAWAAMREVHGVATYAEIAETAGSATAYRAAGSACARNLVPVVVPCHRILTSDRRVGGYYFGGETKTALLEHEGSLGSVHR